jgi:amino acid transporter
MSPGPQNERAGIPSPASGAEQSDKRPALKESAETSQVFVRESTGLVKSASFLDATALNLGNMSVGAALANIGFTTILLQSMVGVNLVIGSLIGFAITIPEIVVYSYMNQRVPRTGGDYIWVSRVFGGLFGSSISFMGYTLETLAYLALITLSAVTAIGAVGFSLGYSGLLSLSIPGAAPLAQFGVGALVFGSIIAVNIFRPRAGFKLVTALIGIGIAATLIAIATLLLAGRTGVENYMSTLVSAGYSSSYASLAGSYHGPEFSWAATIAILPFFAIFTYPWLNASPAVAGELRGNRSFKWAVPLASLIVVSLVTLSFGVMYYVGGFGFTNAALANSQLVVNYGFNFWTLAMGVSSSPILSFIIGLGWIVFELGILAYGVIVFSRYLFAQAFDRFLPTKLAYISPRFGSPVVAHVIDFVITIGLVGGAAFLYGSISQLYGAVAASMIYFIVIGIAAAVYAIRRESGGSRRVLAVAGVAMAAAFAFLTYQFFSAYQVWGGNLLSYGYVAASFVAGLVIYSASKAYHKKRGVDIELAYKEIPPE